MYRSIITVFIVFVLSMIQCYWAMYETKDISSYTLNPLYIEVGQYSVLGALFFSPLAFFYFKKEKSKTIFFLLSIIYLLFFWFYVNKEVFKSRVANWGTFLDNEINREVFSRSMIPIIVCISLYIVFYLVIDKFLSNKLKK